MKQILSMAVVLGWAMASSAALVVNVPVNQLIPDGDLAGLASQVTLSGLDGNIAGLTVGLTISGTYNGDLYAYLEHGNGFAVLLNRVGMSATDSLGYGGADLNVTFQDGAPNIHTYQLDPGYAGGTLTGVWGPDGRAVSPLLVNGTEPASATLSSFLSGDPNGDWTLFVADASGGDLNELVSWSLNLTVVPEPGWFGFGGGVLCLALAGWSHLTRHKGVTSGQP